MSRPRFWADYSQAVRLAKQAAHLKNIVERWEKIQTETDEIRELAASLNKDDQALLEEIKRKYNQLKKRAEALEFFVLLNGKYDSQDALISLHAGAGGVDAQDWTEMLLRMYLRYSQRQSLKTQLQSRSPGKEAGLKSAVLEVSGPYAYGFLKNEAGVHRLVRISPFDAEKMRHTSFALVEVLPVLEEVEVKIDPQDIRLDTFLSSGHGGQSVQTTYSAVRLVHLPTGITVSVQNERSQAQNKETAMKILRARLQKYYEAKQEAERRHLKGELAPAAWGNQIRSYILHPYKLVKDHRTGYETQQIDQVLAGELDNFIEAGLRKIKNDH